MALERVAGMASLIDILDRVIDKGVVVGGRMFLPLDSVEQTTVKQQTIPKIVPPDDDDSGGTPPSLH
jgi:hypothetical protein